MADSVSIDSRSWTGDEESQCAPYRAVPAAPRKLGWGGAVFAGALVGFPIYGLVIHFTWRILGSPTVIRGTPSARSFLTTIVTLVVVWWWGRAQANRAGNGFLAALVAMLGMTVFRATELVVAAHSSGPVDHMSLMVNRAHGPRFGGSDRHLAAIIHAVDRSGQRQDIEGRANLIRGIVAGDSCITIAIDRDGPFRMVRQIAVRSVGDGTPHAFVWDDQRHKCFAP